MKAFFQHHLELLYYLIWPPEFLVWPIPDHPSAIRKPFQYPKEQGILHPRDNQQNQIAGIPEPRELAVQPLHQKLKR